MRQVVRTIVFNVDEEAAVPLRQHLLATEGVKIVADVNEPALLGQAVKRYPADLVIAHLDPDPEALLPVAASVATEHPELAVFAISARADGELILVALRAGLREFLIKPVDPEQLSEAIDKVRSYQTESVSNGQLISIMGSIGGAGATVIASNLAVELKQLTDQKVAVVDLDFRFGQLATCFDLHPTYTVSDLCETDEQVEVEMIERTMNEHESGVHVLARLSQLAQAEQITAARCVSVLSALQEIYEYVIVDGPSRFDPTARSILDMSDMSLLVVQLLVFSVRNTHRILEELSSHGYNMDRTHLICNREGRDSGYLEAHHVSETLNREFFAQIPDDWTAVSSAMNVGEPLLTACPKGRARQAIKALAESVHSGPSDDSSEAQPTSKGGVLSKLFT